MIIQETRVNAENEIETGYFLTIDDLIAFVEEYEATHEDKESYFSKFTTKFYTEDWLKKHKQVKPKPKMINF